MRDKVLVINGGSYYSPFRKFGQIEQSYEILLHRPNCVKLAVFTGGSDVDPSFYGEKKSQRTFSTPSRDREESMVFDKLLELNIPMFGICRGIQFLCAMAGGKLCQHLDHHAGNKHNMLTNENKSIIVNSLHHQMAIPSGINHIVLGYAEPRLSNKYIDGNDELMEVTHEYEAIYFSDINAVGVQYHPEMMSPNSDGHQYATKLAEQLLDDGFTK